MKTYRLNIRVNDPDLLDLYQNHSTYHSGDSGLDLFVPKTEVIPARARGFILNLGISCEMQVFQVTCSDPNLQEIRNKSGDFITYGKETQDKSAIILLPGSCSYKYDIASYCLYPRSSLGAKTPLRLANSVGIIDAGYRGPICAILDNLSDQDFIVQRGERLVQICRPNLKPFKMIVVDELSGSERGERGIGSTSE